MERSIDRRGQTDGQQNSSQSGLALAKLCLPFLGVVRLVGEVVQETASQQSTSVRRQLAWELVEPSWEVSKLISRIADTNA